MTSRPCRVFISYRRISGEWLSLLVMQRLQSRGYLVFRDQDSLVGDDWKLRLADAIRETDYVVLVLTRQSLDKCSEPDDPVTWEIQTSIAAGKIIRPLVDRSAGIDFKSLPDSVAPIISKPQRCEISPENARFDRDIGDFASRFLAWPMSAVDPWAVAKPMSAPPGLITKRRGRSVLVRIAPGAAERRDMFAWLDCHYQAQKTGEGRWCFTIEHFEESVEPDFRHRFQS